MIDNITSYRFRLYFSENFFYEEVESKYLNILREMSFDYRRLTDYISMTIDNGYIPGINAEPSKEQFINKGDVKQSYSSLHPKRLLSSRKLSINFKLKNYYFNYFVLFEHLMLYLDPDSRENKSNYLSPIILDIYDDMGNIIMKVTYKDVIFTGISDINLDKSNISIKADTFKCDFVFNDVKIDNYLIDRIDEINNQMTY